MGSTVTAPNGQAVPPLRRERRHDVLCVPSSDAEFRSAVHAAVEAVSPTSDVVPAAVESILHTCYPNATLVARNELASYDPAPTWYAMRDGRPSRDPRRRILIVDDDSSLADLLVHAFEDDRFAVHSAPDGAAALAVVADWPPDLIILDLGMPVMNGEEFARQYRELPPPHAPIVVVSGAFDAPAQSARIAARSVMGKPLDLDLLIRLVDRYA